MVRLLPLVLLLLLGCSERQEPPKTATCNTPKAPLEDRAALQARLDSIGSVACCERYIQKVIREGSDVLKLPAGPMAAGYADAASAEKIAAYVITLSGRSPSHPEYVREGNLYYDGNCGGCHGDDGKGLGGAYPDVTLRLFEGMKKEAAALRTQLESHSKATP
ncbi:MAG: hypothetical protein JXK05_14640 [Campylobacterales bacterium]|nr:hypothetical protein [Campylobacterales bacterium]